MVALNRSHRTLHPRRIRRIRRQLLILLLVTRHHLPTPLLLRIPLFTVLLCMALLPRTPHFQPTHLKLILLLLSSHPLHSVHILLTDQLYPLTNHRFLIRPRTFHLLCRRSLLRLRLHPLLRHPRIHLPCLSVATFHLRCCRSRIPFIRTLHLLPLSHRTLECHLFRTLITLLILRSQPLDLAHLCRTHRTLLLLLTLLHIRASCLGRWNPCLRNA